MQLGPGRSPCRRDERCTVAAHRKQRLWPFAAPVKSTERSEACRRSPIVVASGPRGGRCFLREQPKHWAAQAMLWVREGVRGGLVRE